MREIPVAAATYAAAGTNKSDTLQREDAKTLGTPPILMKNGILKAKLKLDPAKKFAVYPLALNGLRREKLPLQFKDGILKIEIDNSKLPNGATSMFEIVAE